MAYWLEEEAVIGASKNFGPRASSALPVLKPLSCFLGWCPVYHLRRNVIRLAVHSISEIPYVRRGAIAHRANYHKATSLARCR